MSIFNKLFNSGANKLKSFTIINGFGLSYSFASLKDRDIVNNSYLSNDDVYSMVSKAAKTISNNIKWKLCTYNSEGEKEEITEGELYELLNNPNKYQSLTEFREQAYSYLLVSGRSFIGGLKSLGFGDSYTSLHNLPSQITDIKIGDLTDPILSYHVNWDLKRDWLPEDVLYTKNVTLDHNNWFDGLSPFTPAAKLLESSNNLVTADASTLKNRGASGILTNRADDVMLDHEKEEIAKALKKQIGGADKFNQIIPTSANVDLLQFGLSPKDLEILNSDISKRRRFSNIFGFDSGEFNDPQNKTFNSRKEAAKSAYQNVYIPLDRKILDGLNHWLIPKFYPDQNVMIESDLSDIDVLQQDKLLNAQIKQINSVEARNILQDYNTNVINADSAKVLLHNMGYNKNEIELLIKDITNEQNENN